MFNFLSFWSERGETSSSLISLAFETFSTQVGYGEEEWEKEFDSLRLNSHITSCSLSVSFGYI